MDQKKFTTLSDQELLQEQKKMKSNKIINALLIGVLVGVTVYSVIKKGFGFFSFLPLFMGYFLFKNTANSKLMEKELMEEIKSRNLI